MKPNYNQLQTIASITDIDKMDSHNSNDEGPFCMVEILSEELGEKENIIIELEKELKKQKNLLKITLLINLVEHIKDNQDFLDEGLSVSFNTVEIYKEIFDDMNSSVDVPFGKIPPFTPHS